MKKVSSMNGGDGETSYANNSFFQKMVMIKTLPIVKDTLKHMLHDQDYYHINSPRKYLKMVDLGCSSGPNAIFTISHVIDTIENLCKEKEYCLAMPEIEVFLNDLPRNDFNNLFKLLANFYKENGEKMAKCFVYGLPGSFYGRLFPNKSLHFAFSCCSLHWLSQVPEGLSNKNKYDIYIAPASPPEVLQVYAKQFEKDFSTFLRLRSQEMISGGHMVLTFLGRSVEDPKSKDDSGYVLSLFSAALADMVAEGLVKADDLSSCNLPMYMPCKQEVEKIIEGGCSFTLDKLHVFRVRCDVTYDEHHHDEDMDDEENYLSSSNKYKNGKVMSDSFRAIMEPMLARHFGLEGSNMDSLFQRLLQGKVAVITGGARGIGAATAKLFSENGAYVVIADVLDALGTKLAESIGGRYTHCDVSREQDVERAVHLAVQWKGRLDIMFNNAGISGPEGSITTLKMEDMTSLLSINLYGVVHGIKHAARAMIESKTCGTIVNSSSSAAIMGGLASHAYTLSKGAILGLCRSAACELGAHGIRVNCVSPHGVPSEMLLSAYRRILGKEDLKAEDVCKIVGEKGSVIRGRGGSVEDVARGVLFLACEDSGFVTGHNLVIDGGYTSACNHMSFIYQG